MGAAATGISLGENNRYCPGRFPKFQSATLQRTFFAKRKGELLPHSGMRKDRFIEEKCRLPGVQKRMENQLHHIYGKMG
jgi:hypothetical protein